MTFSKAITDSEAEVGLHCNIIDTTRRLLGFLGGEASLFGSQTWYQITSHLEELGPGTELHHRGRCCCYTLPHSLPAAPHFPTSPLFWLSPLMLHLLPAGSASKRMSGSLGGDESPLRVSKPVVVKPEMQFHWSFLFLFSLDVELSPRCPSQSELL